ncbi:MAG TPA: DinB family protein [Acidobacteriaceae bacterium]
MTTAATPAATSALLLLQDFDTEISNTRRTLERVPEDQGEWRPHPKSMPLGKLAMHCAGLPMFGFYIMEEEGMDLAHPTLPPPQMTFTSRENCLRLLEETSAKSRAALAAASNEALAHPWRFSFGEHLISNDPRSLAFRYMCFNHLVHHTAQLGVYLRLLDIPVPALYGPSADEQWLPAK